MTCGVVLAEEPDTDEVVFDSTFLAENPELMTAIRYNPTLMSIGHNENKSVADAAFYGANPELIFAHSYMAALEENNSLFASR
jgi:hypothetical protein